MRKFLSTVVLLFTISLALFSQEIVHVFPFGKPFRYFNFKYDDDFIPGIWKMYFTQAGNIIFQDCDTRSWYIYDREYNFLNKFDSYSLGDYQPGITHSNYFTVGPLLQDEMILIFDENISLKQPQYLLSAPDDLPGYYSIFNNSVPVQIANMFFVEMGKGNFLSWELFSEGKYLYRGIAETKEWFSERNMEIYGYQKIGNHGAFGDFNTDNNGLYGWKDLLDYIYPENSITLLSLENFEYIGSDSRGLNYYYSLKGQKGLSFDFGYVTPPVEVMIVVVDTWTKKVTIKLYPPGMWSSPWNWPGLIGFYAWTVHPNGDVYFTDIDFDAQAYLVRRLKNTWWEEIGINNREIGQISGNYIPLKTEADDNAPNNGYNYQNDFVWIQERKAGTDWIRIRKLDGREGWIHQDMVRYTVYDEQANTGNSAIRVQKNEGWRMQREY